MRNASFSMKSGLAACTMFMLLAACEQPAKPATPSPDVPAPQVPAAAMPPPGPDMAAATAATKAPAAEPTLESMLRASVSASKMGVPVDLSYQFDGDVEKGQPAMLHLAAVPRVSGGNMKVSIKEVAGIRISAGPMTAQKVTATTAYRQQMTVSKLAGGPQELRVLVTMDLPEGAAFGWFSVPFGATPVASKLAPVKQQ